MADYVTRQGEIARQRKLADLLRVAAEKSQYEAPQGQMVSGHYVAPSWSQHLSNFVDPIIARQKAGTAEREALGAEQAYGADVARAREQWQGGLPQTRAATPELAGPVDPRNPVELQAQPAQLPNREAILKHTLAGLDIPGNEKAVALWNQGMGAEWEREDKQKEALALRKMQEEELLRQRIEKGEQQAADRVEKAEQNELERQKDLRIAADANETRRALAAAVAATKAANKSERGGLTARDLLLDVRDFGKAAGPVAATVSAAQKVQDLIDENTDPKTGVTKSIPGIGRDTLLPGVVRSVGQQVGILDPKTNPNAAKVQRVVSDIMRQEAGLSQTISEQSRVILTNLASGEYTQKEFLEAWGELTDAINNKVTHTKAYHLPESVATYEERSGPLTTVVKRPGRAAQSPQRASGVVTQPGAAIQPGVDPARTRLEELRRKAAGG